MRFPIPILTSLGRMRMQLEHNLPDSFVPVVNSQDLKVGVKEKDVGKTNNDY